MKITLNGQERTLENIPNLKILIEQFCQDSQHVVAEVNGAIIRNAHWDQHILTEGDTVELVNIVGGG